MSADRADQTPGLDERRKLILAFLTGVLVGTTAGVLLGKPLLGAGFGVALGVTSVLRRKTAASIDRAVDEAVEEESARRR